MRDYKILFSDLFNDDEIKLLENARSYAIATCRELWKGKSKEEIEKNFLLKSELFIYAGEIVKRYLDRYSLTNLEFKVYKQISDDVIEELNIFN